MGALARGVVRAGEGVGEKGEGVDGEVDVILVVAGACEWQSGKEGCWRAGDFRQPWRVQAPSSREPVNPCPYYIILRAKNRSPPFFHGISMSICSNHGHVLERA